MSLSTVLGAVLIIMRRQRRRRQRGTIGNYEVINRAAAVPRQRMVWSEREDSLSDMDFVRRYRMSKDCFGDLVRVLQPILDPTTLGSNGSQRVPTELCLSLTLRIVAGGSYLDVADIHGLATTTVQKHFWRTVQALVETLTLDLRLDDPAGLEALEEGFADASNGIVRGCVGALDGVVFKIHKPPEGEAPSRYYCRKGWFAVNAQVVCDSNRRITYLSTCPSLTYANAPLSLTYPMLSTGTVCAGATHDSTAFKCSSLWQALDAGMLSEDFWIAGDPAYRGISPQIITTYSGNGLTERQSAFNFVHSSTCRINIE